MKFPQERAEDARRDDYDGRRWNSDYSDDGDKIGVKSAVDSSRKYHNEDSLRKYRNEDNGSRSRNALVANLIATKSILLERERASEEVMEKAIEVALLNERNAQLRARLRVESKAHFDKQVISNNFNYLYDVF